jgi:hypothetical protein
MIMNGKEVRIWKGTEHCLTATLVFAWGTEENEEKHK